MTFDEWQQKHGPNGGAYDIEMMRAGWDAATKIEREACADACEREHVGEDVHDDCDNDGDKAYNKALRDAINSIKDRGKK